MKSITLTLLLLFASHSLAENAHPQKVSLFQLLSSPDKYHGKKVLVQGYLHNQFEDSALYFSKEQADFLMGENALWIAYAKEVELRASTAKSKPENTRYFDCKYVLMVGEFDRNEKGHLGMFNGGLKNVTSVLEIDQVFNGKKPLK